MVAMVPGDKDAAFRPSQKSQGRLLDPRLGDVFVAAILPGQPTWALGALRGTGRFLRDLLDSHATSHIWMAATQCQLWNQPRSRCLHVQGENENELESRHDACSICIQLLLRRQGIAIQRLQAPCVKISQFTGWNGWNRHESFGRLWPADKPVLIWSHCSRWVAVKKAGGFRFDEDDDDDHLYRYSHGGYSYHDDDQEFEGVPYSRYNRNPGTCRVVVIDTQGGRKWDHQHEHLTSAQGCKSLHWRATELGILPNIFTDGSTWLAFTNRSPAITGLFRCGLVCRNFAEQKIEEVLGEEGQRFELAAEACKAAAYSGHGNVVALYDLPSLNNFLTLREGALGSCTAKAVRFSCNAGLLAVWWRTAQPGEPASSMQLVVYNTSNGQRMACVLEHEDSMPGWINVDVAHYCILAWSPTAEKLLFCMRGLYHLLNVSACTYTATQVQPLNDLWSKELPPDPIWVHNPRLPAYGWTSGSNLMVEGQPMRMQLDSSASMTDPDSPDYIFLTDSDGWILDKWQKSAGWQRMSFQEERKRYGFGGGRIRRSSAAEAAWTSTAHVLDPVWSLGHPPILQPHHPLVALLSNQVDSNLGLAFQPLDGIEMSPCGRMILAAPGRTPSSRRPSGQPFSTQLVWDEHRLEMVRHETKLPTWTLFAWHPAASIHPFFAIATERGDVLLVDGAQPCNPVRWRYRDLCKEYDTSSDGVRYMLSWDAMAWSPDGTKLLLVTRRSATAVEFTSSAPEPAKNKAWRGIKSKLRKLLSR